MSTKYVVHDLRAEISDEELVEVASTAGLPWETWEDELITFARAIWDRAVLARWGGAAVQPVPLDNRPWEQPDWCDEEGNCWVGYPLTWCDEEGNCWAEYPSITKNLYKIRPEWLSTNPTYISSRKDSRAEFVVLLPHWALPVPAADEGEGQP